MNFFENEYPGNTSTYEKFSNAMQNEGVVAFTGAGTSMPELPSWTALLKNLIQDAVNSGITSKDDGEAYIDGIEDTLFIADQLSGDFGAHQFKSKVCKTFSCLENPTEAQKEIIGTGFKRYVTLNYDLGLELASSCIGGGHLPSITPQQRNESQSWIGKESSKNKKAVLHWHGITTHAEDIILTGDDYSAFYDKTSENIEFLSRLFVNDRILMIGFGFADPFITRPLEKVMRLHPSENNHFALLGVPENKQINVVLERKKFAKKFKLDVIFYPIRVGEDGSQDHSELLNILKEFRSTFSTTGTEVDGGETELGDLSENSFRTGLFSVGGRQIFCEPNIWNGRSNSKAAEPTEIVLSKLVSLDENLLILAPHEYGLTTLGKKITSEISASGQICFYREASKLPNYRKKLLQLEELAELENKEFCLVLDNYSSLDHERLLNEILSTFERIRVILLQRSSASDGNLSDDFEERGFKIFELHGLRRENIREVVQAFLPAERDDNVSLVVDKVYSDLLQLCIPLTPANVVMYTNVLCKDGDFTPVSRLHIVDRFVSDALQRASDAYADSFNAGNKIDLISKFCLNLFEAGLWTFNARDWFEYCDEYKQNTLNAFNAKEVLSDLIEGRIIGQYGERFSFKYKMFFSYFVGRYISARPDLLEEYVGKDAHLALSGLVEVLCGLAPDSSVVIENLSEKLSRASQEFYEAYQINGIDLHQGLEWEIGDGEDNTWGDVSKKIDAGPTQGAELDKLKTSISAETRTVDQKVEIIKFVAQEKNIGFLATHLRLALDSSSHSRAEIKKKATEGIIGYFQLTYEVASILAPMIANRKYVSWNGFAYINLIESKDRDGAVQGNKQDIMLRNVIRSLPKSIAVSAADEFGSRKLGEVFSVLAKDKDRSVFSTYLVFTLILRSKPEHWLNTAKILIRSMNRTDIYLAHMLSVALTQFKEEINTSKERSELKQIIAEIRIKRELGVKAPNRSLVGKTINKMEKSGFIEK